MTESKTVSQIASELGVNERTVREWIKERFFPGAFRKGPKKNSPWAIPVKDYEKFKETYMSPISEDSVAEG